MRISAKLLVTLVMTIVLAAVMGCGATETQEAPAAPAAAAPAPAPEPVAAVQPQAPQQPAPAAPALAAVQAPAPIQPKAPVAPAPVSARDIPDVGEGEPQFGGNARGIAQSNFPAIDAQWTGATVVQYLPSNMAETPFTRDFDDQIQPSVVDKWEVSGDGLKWTFTIRDGLKFHNGEPVTAADVVGSYKRSYTTFSRNLEPALGEITADDNLNLTFHLTEPSGLVILGLTAPPGHRAAWVQPKEIWSVPRTTAVDTIISTGPYKFVEWIVGDRVVMERWEDYQPRSEPTSYMAGGHTAYIDTVQWLEVPDFATRVAALTTGEVDWVDEYPGDFAKIIEDSDKAVFTTGKPGRWVGIRLNLTKPPFDNREVRQAIYMGIDADTILKTAAGGPKGKFWDTCPGIFGCGMNKMPFDSTAGEATYNQKALAQAKAKLKELGVVGTKIEMTSPEDLAFFNTMTKPFAEYLEELGFVVDFRATDWGAIIASFQDIDAWHTTITASKLGYLFTPLHWDGLLTDKATNGFDDPTGKGKELFARLTKETDPARIQAIADQIQELYYEELPYIFLGMQTWANGRSARIKNFANKHTPFWSDAWLEK